LLRNVFSFSSKVALVGSISCVKLVLCLVPH
jgi:hypothetical protein